MDEKPSKCRTLLLGDKPSEKDEFGQHEKVAKAISEMISEEAEGRAVALFGSWGSGKSTVIEILKHLVAHDKEKHVFVFDAWAHQGDPLRRAFLEQEIKSLTSSLWLKEKDWAAALEGLAKRLKISTTKQVPKLTLSGVAFLWAAIIAPVGLAILSGTNVQPKSRLMWFGMGLSFCPFFALLLGALLKSVFSKTETNTPETGGTRNNGLLSWFVSQSETVTRNETAETPEPTSIEFNELFLKVLRSALSVKSRKFVIVVDNLDRVPTQDALSIWSTMRTFFEHSDAPNRDLIGRLWLIVPFDKAAAVNLWSASGNIAGTELAQAFIQKTFQSSFHVSAPVVSDLTRYFNGRLAAAFPGHAGKNDFQQIYALYVILAMKGGRLVTPREVKIFINTLGGLHRQWGDTIPLPHQALYVLCQDQIEKQPQSLTGFAFPESTAVDVLEEKKDLKTNLAALHFGVEPKKALEVLIGPEISRALVSGDSGELEKYQELEGFPVVLSTVVREICARPGGEDSKYIASASLACSGIQSLDSFQTKVIWESLRKAIVGVSRWNLDSKIGSGIVAAIIHTDDLELERITPAILTSISQGFQTEDEKGIHDWRAGAIIILKELDVRKMLEKTDLPFSVPGNPKFYFTAVEGILSKASPNIQRLLKPRWGENQLLDFIVNAVKSGQITEKEVEGLKTIRSVPGSWQFVPIEQAVRERLSAGSIGNDEAACLVDITNDFVKNSTENAASTMNWLCRNGIILHYLNRSRNGNSSSAAAKLILTFFEQNHEQSLQANWGESVQGIQVYRQFLLGVEPGLASVFDEFAKIISLRDKLDWFLKTCREKKENASLVSSILGRIASSEHLREKITIVTFFEYFLTFQTTLSEDQMHETIQSIAKNENLTERLLHEEFRKDWGPVYGLLWSEDIEARPLLTAHILKGMMHLSKDNWLNEMAVEGTLLELLIDLLGAGTKADLTNSFQNALSDYVKEFVQGKQQPKKLLPYWHLLPKALAPHAGRIFYENLLDSLSGFNQKGRERVLLLLDSDFIPEEISADDADDIVRRIFIEIIKTRNQPELDWLQRTLVGRSHIYQSARGDFKTAFADELNTALVEKPEGMEKAKIRAISQLSTVSKGSIKEVDAGEAFTVEAAEATLYGRFFCVEDFDNKLSIGCWTSRDEYVEWVIRLRRSRRFNISLDFSCAADHGGDFVLSLGEKQVSGKVSPTGDWKSFQTMKLGAVDLSEGIQSVRVKPSGEFRRALMNLRFITFTPDTQKL